MERPLAAALLPPGTRVASPAEHGIAGCQPPSGGLSVCLEAMGFVSPEKLLLVALLVALVFGTKGLPSLARRAGKGIRDTREALGIDAIRDDIHDMRSTFTEPSGDTKPADASAEPEGHDEVTGSPHTP